MTNSTGHQLHDIKVRCYKCDTIKGNELDVRNDDFKLQSKEVINSSVLNCFKLQKMFISPQPYVPLRWGLDQNLAF